MNSKEVILNAMEMYYTLNNSIKLIMEATQNDACFSEISLLQTLVFMSLDKEFYPEPVFSFNTAAFEKEPELRKNIDRLRDHGMLHITVETSETLTIRLSEKLFDIYQEKETKTNFNKIFKGGSNDHFQQN